eukprot:2011616-Prymnesium_polylepis.2
MTTTGDGGGNPAAVTVDVSAASCMRSLRVISVPHIPSSCVRERISSTKKMSKGGGTSGATRSASASEAVVVVVMSGEGRSLRSLRSSSVLLTTMSSSSSTRSPGGASIPVTMSVVLPLRSSRSGRTRGNVTANENWAPSPHRVGLTSAISPPIRLTSACESGSPSPVPLVMIADCACSKGRKMAA